MEKYINKKTILSVLITVLLCSIILFALFNNFHNSTQKDLEKTVENYFDNMIAGEFETALAMRYYPLEFVSEKESYKQYLEEYGTDVTNYNIMKSYKINNELYEVEVDTFNDDFKEHWYIIFFKNNDKWEMVFNHYYLRQFIDKIPD